MRGLAASAVVVLLFSGCIGEPATVAPEARKSPREQIILDGVVGQYVCPPAGAQSCSYFEVSPDNSVLDLASELHAFSLDLEWSATAAVTESLLFAVYACDADCEQIDIVVEVTGESPLHIESPTPLSPRDVFFVEVLPTTCVNDAAVYGCISGVEQSFRITGWVDGGAQ